MEQTSLGLKCYVRPWGETSNLCVARKTMMMPPPINQYSSPLRRVVAGRTTMPNLFFCVRNRFSQSSQPTFFRSIELKICTRIHDGLEVPNENIYGVGATTPSYNFGHFWYFFVLLGLNIAHTYSVIARRNLSPQYIRGTGAAGPS